MRSLAIIAALVLAIPGAALAQGQGNGAPSAGGGSPDCRIRMTAAPTVWMIQGHDPFGTERPEGTFGATFTNESGKACAFEPVFELAQPPFGLSNGPGRQIRYTLMDMDQTRDVTPRSGQSRRIGAVSSISLDANETRTLLFKLVAEPNDIRESGTFTEDVTLVAQDSLFRSLGGIRLVLGITVLPSARLGLAGAYSMSDGRAMVDLGELREGLAPVPLQLRVSSTGRYDIGVTSANFGSLRLGSTPWHVPYSMVIGGNPVNLTGAATVSSANTSGFARDSLPVQFVIGEVDGQMAGLYSDVVTIDVTAH
jgi:hypothetical protein